MIPSQIPPKLTKRLLIYYFATGIIESLISFWMLAQVYADPKNQWLFGYSKSRLGLMALTLGMAVFFGVLLLTKAYQSNFLHQLFAKTLGIFGFSLPVLVLFFTGTVVYPYLRAATITPKEALLERLAPLFILLTSRLVQLAIISLMALIGTPKGKRQWRVTKEQLSVILLVITSTLVVAHLSMHFIRQVTAHKEIWAMRAYFDLNSEKNLPTFFSALLLMIASYYILHIAVRKIRRRERYRAAWLGLGILFLGLALDEYFIFHEQLDYFIRTGINPDSIFAQSWIFSGMIIMLVLVVIFWRFFINLPIKTRWGFFWAAFLYVGGALGFEILGHFFNHGYGTFFLALTTTEEIFEMTGMILFIYVLRDYIEGLNTA